MLVLRTWFACVIMLSPGLVEAKDRYDERTLCPELYTEGLPSDVVQKAYRECDHRVEKAVSRDVPGVVERTGALLSIRAKNGKVIQRKSTKTPGEDHRETWVCDYFARWGYVRVCYRFFESSGTEFVNLNTGTATFVAGGPAYSPSGERILMVDGYGGEVYKIEIWRFGTDRLIRELQIQPPSEQDWEGASWTSETEVALGQRFDKTGPKHLLSKRIGLWEHREQ